MGKEPESISRQCQDDVAVALAWLAQRFEPVDHGKSDT